MGDRFGPFVDRWLADSYGISLDELHVAGTRVITGAPAFGDYRGIHVYRLGETVLVAAPTVPQPFGVVLGPSQHAYLHRDDFAARAAAVARRVEPSPAVDAFRAALGDGDFHEGGFGDDPWPDVMWAVHADADRIVAMGNMTDFAGEPADVGLATLPEVRGTGIASALATDMLVACFASGVEVARYRALTTNHASLAIAAKLGFTPYGENVAIRPRER